MSAFATMKLAHDVLKMIDRASETALVQTAAAVRKDIKKAQVIPFDTGELQDSMFSDDGLVVHRKQVDIVFSTPYARRLFYNPESVPVRGYTRADGTEVKPYTAGKMSFHTEEWTDSGGKYHNRANANAKDHWTEDWEEGGAREDFAQEQFAKAFRREARL